MKNAIKFPDLMAKVALASKNNSDARIPIGELVEAFSGGDTFAVEQGQFVLTANGFSDLSSATGFPKAALDRLSSDPGLQKSVLRHVVSENPDKIVDLRITGNRITDILSSEYHLVKNIEIVQQVIALSSAGHLPPMDQVLVGPHNVSKDGRVFSARLLAPNVWNYDLGNGRKDPVYGSMYMNNSENGGMAFKCGAALARVACFNWTIGNFQLGGNHRYNDLDDFRSHLESTAKVIDGYSREMAEGMKALKGERLQHPEIVFEKVAERLGIPAHAMPIGREYLQNETDMDNIFDVVQAVTRSSQQISDPGGRKRPRWDLREAVEQNVLALAEEIISQGEDSFVTTVADVIEVLGQFDPDMEAVNIRPTVTTLRGREVIIN